MRWNGLARCVAAIARSDDDGDDGDDDDDARRGELRARAPKRGCTAESMVVRRWCVCRGDLRSVV